MLGEVELVRAVSTAAHVVRQLGENLLVEVEEDVGSNGEEDRHLQSVKTEGGVAHGDKSVAKIANVLEVVRLGPVIVAVPEAVIIASKIGSDGKRNRDPNDGEGELQEKVDADLVDDGQYATVSSEEEWCDNHRAEERTRRDYANDDGRDDCTPCRLDRWRVAVVVIDDGDSYTCRSEG